MTAFRGVAMALVRGFVRDRSAVFFALVFPLMFLVLFSSIFDSAASPRLDLVQVGPVPVIDDLPAEGRSSFDDAFDVRVTDDLDAARAEVRAGDADVAVTMDGAELVASYTQTDQVRAAVVRGTLMAFVDAANQAASGVPPAFTFRAEAVEDEALRPVQFFTPGLLGWAVAMSAAIGAASTLQGWRQTKLMSRIQLSAAPAAVVVSARVVVTVGVALVQMAVFLAVAMALFDLRLEGRWWLAVPLLVAGTISFMTLGLLAGAISKTQEGAVNTANFLVLPMAFLSGSFFILDGAPEWLQRISQLMPLRHLNDGMIDVLVRGEGVAATVGPMAYLLGFGLVVGGLAAVLFRRRDA